MHQEKKSLCFTASNAPPETLVPLKPVDSAPTRDVEDEENVAPVLAGTKRRARFDAPVRPAPAAAGGSTAAPSTSAPSLVTYRVFYTKRNPNKKRKNKVYQDGVLACRPGSGCELFDEEGKASGASLLSIPSGSCG